MLAQAEHRQVVHGPEALAAVVGAEQPRLDAADPQGAAVVRDCEAEHGIGRRGDALEGSASVPRAAQLGAEAHRGADVEGVGVRRVDAAHPRRVRDARVGHERGDGPAPVVAAVEHRSELGARAAREVEPRGVGGRDLDRVEGHATHTRVEARRLHRRAVDAEDRRRRPGVRLDREEGPARGVAREVGEGVGRRPGNVGRAAPGGREAEAVLIAVEYGAARRDLDRGVDVGGRNEGVVQALLADPVEGPTSVGAQQDAEGHAQRDHVARRAGADHHLLRGGEATVRARCRGREGEERRDQSASEGASHAGDYLRASARRQAPRGGSGV